MTELCVAVESYALRGANPEALVPTVQLTLAGEAITVAELIRRTLIEQLSELTVKKMLDSVMARDRIERQYLTAAEISQQAQAGSIRAPGSGIPAPETPQFDVDREVKKAWRGFERRAFRVVVDGHMPTALDQELRLRADSKVAFMRLTPLVGG